MGPLRRVFGAWAQQLGRPLPLPVEELAQQLRGPTLPGSIQMLRTLTGCFEQALADAATTAWVCAEPYAGVYAIRFLADKGIQVPGRLSVMAVDDTRAALVNHVTCCNLNVQSIAAAMVAYVAGYPPLRGLGSRPPRQPCST